MFRIFDLRTEAMLNPLGIDIEKPAFSWKLDSEERGFKQTAYKVVVAKDCGFNEIIWDSEKVISDKQTVVLYNGEKLVPSQRYFVKVIIWGSDGTSSESETAWFETGLMGKDVSVWSGAEWIGNPQKTSNTAATSTYIYAVDFKVEKGNKAGIVLAGRNKDNYALYEIDMDNRKIKAFEYSDEAWDGSYEERAKSHTKEPEYDTVMVTALGNPVGYDITEEAVTADRINEFNRIEIQVADKNVTIMINGIILVDNEELMPANINFRPRKAFLMSVGFKQLGSEAVYTNMFIKNTKTGEIYIDEAFKDEKSPMSVLGTVSDGVLTVSDRFELMCPVPGVNVKRSFKTEKEIESARLYAAAMGFYQVYLNGKKVGDDYLNPGFTDYRLRIQYQTYDVTDMLNDGSNVMLATVGKGWYSGFVGYSGPMRYGSQNYFIGKLLIRYKDGTEKIIVTDKDWLFTDKGPLVDSDYLDGENYDARLEFTGWEKESYDNYLWKSCGVQAWPAEVIPTNGEFTEKVDFELTAQIGATAKVERILPSLSVVENPKGHFVYDFGQNMVGTIKLCVRGKRGFSIKIRYGEMSYRNGEIYIKNIRSATNTDIYTFSGNEEGETFIPSFTSHGFRYVEITGNGFCLDNNDFILSIEGLVLCNVTELTGDFKCSDELINKLQSNIQWGQRGNYLLVPTDCPQRNERMGWTGDAQVFAGTAAYNMQVQPFTNKWLQDVRDGQLMYNKQGGVPDTAPLGGDNRKTACAGWADASVIVPWEMYKAYGDIRVLEDNYDMMKKWIKFQDMADRQNYGLRTVDGVEVPGQSDLASIPYIQTQQARGDHLTFDETTPFILSATAYAAYVVKLMITIARLLGKEEDAVWYEERFEKVKQAFNEAWVCEDGSLAYWGEMCKGTPDINGNIINKTYYSNEEGNKNHPSQTAYALAIDFGLIPEEKLPRATECFLQSIKDRGGHLSVGFLGISHLNPALTKCGQLDMAFSLLEKKTNPSWLYSVINGATTIWERWNSYIAETDTFGDVSMNSFNHYAYGAIGEWMYKCILGIDTLETIDGSGYKKIKLMPVTGGSLTEAEGWHESPYGRIESGWKLNESSFEYKCRVPVGSTATLYLPEYADITEKGIAADKAEGVKFIGKADGRLIYELECGGYAFMCK